MKSQRISGFWLLVCLALLPALGSGQADRDHHFAAGERARAAGQDSLARLAYRASMRDDTGKEVADSLSGLAYQWIATMYLNEYEDTLALPYFRRSLAIRDSLFRGPHNERAHIRTNMALSINYIGMQDSARLLLQEANEIYGELRHPDSIIWLIALNELSMHAISREDYGQAYSTTYRAIDLCEALPRVDSLTRFHTYYRAARVHHNFTDHATALGLAREALVALPVTAVFLRVNCLNLIALLERETGDPESSFRHLRESLRISQSNVKTTAKPRANALLYLAEHYALAGDARRARRYEQAALALYHELQSLASYYYRTQLSRCDLRAGRYAAAAARLNGAVTYLRAEEGANSPENLLQLARNLQERARLHRATGDDRAALADLEAAFDLQDRLRRDFTDPASRRYLAQDMSADLDLGVRLHYAAYLEGGGEGELWQAFRLSERARAFSLLTDLGRENAGQEILRLREKVAELEREVAWGDTLRRNELAGHRTRLAGLLRRTQNADRLIPGLDSLALMRYLQDHQTQLVEYYLGDSVQLAFLLSPEGSLRAFSLALGDRLTQEVAEWVAAIGESAYQRKSLRPRAEQSRLDSLFHRRGVDLADRVLPVDLREALHSDLAVCLVPDSVLNYLPFAALPLGDGETSPVLDYQRLPYVQDLGRISYAYSAAFLLAMAQLPPRPYDLDLLALAPGFGAEQRVTRTRAASRGVPLAPLIFNQEEARRIGEIIPRSLVYCDREATRQCFLDRLGESRILHLSTHGLVDTHKPELSFVAFHQPPGRLDERELLYFNDLYGLPIDNELTVLSACETGLGQLAGGEAPLSFATAFAAAGARSTLTTLWQVDDRATKELMVHFYRQLAAGQSRRAALAAAQDSLRTSTDYFHPFYWAAPTLYGLTGPVELAAPTVSAGFGWSWSWLAVAAVSLFAALGRILYRTS